MRDLTLGLEVVLIGGKVIICYPVLKKQHWTWLKNLFISAEGTLGVITAATYKLFPRPKATATAFAGLRDINAGIELLNLCQANGGGNIIAFELMRVPLLKMCCILSGLSATTGRHCPFCLN